MIRVFTIEREYGSQGAEFAHRLAERLNWKLIDRCLIDEIAHKAGVTQSLAERCDERLDPWYYRMGKSFWHGSLDRLPAPPKDQVFDSETHGGVRKELFEAGGNRRQLRDRGAWRCLRPGLGTRGFQHFCVRLHDPQDPLV